MSSSKYLPGTALDVGKLLCAYCKMTLQDTPHHRRSLKEGRKNLFCDAFCYAKYRKQWAGKNNPKYCHGAYADGKRSSEYESWAGMIARCHCITHKRYKDYGGRGIKVCDQWRNSFSNFLEDMGQKPDKNYSVERIDNNGNYEPSNTKWASPKEQNNNRRDVKKFTYKDESLSIAQWARKENIKYTTLHGRLRRGLTIEEALHVKKNYRL